MPDKSRCKLFLIYVLLLLLPNTVIGQIIEVIPPPPVMGDHNDLIRSTSSPILATIETTGNGQAQSTTSFSLDAALWLSDLSGDINSRGMGLDVDNHTDAGQKNLPNISADWEFTHGIKFQLSYFRANHSDNTNKNISFDGLNFTSGAVARVRNNSFSSGLAKVIGRDENYTLNALVGLVSNQVNTKIAQHLAAGSRSGSINHKFIMPYLGIEGESILSRHASVNAAVKFFDRKHSGDANRYSDYHLTLNFGKNHLETSASQHWYGFVGYRYFMAHNDSDGNSSKVIYSGPKVGIRGAF